MFPTHIDDIDTSDWTDDEIEDWLDYHAQFVVELERQQAEDARQDALNAHLRSLRSSDDVPVHLWPDAPPSYRTTSELR